MKPVLMIPARIESKRLIHKNLLNFFNGLTLVDLAIKKAKAACSFDIWLNSPNESFSELAQKHGIKFYLRDKSLNSPNSTNSDFVKDFILNTDYDTIFMLNTTSPLIRKNSTKKFIAEFLNSDNDTSLSVLEEQAPIVINNEPVNWSICEHTPSEKLASYKKIVWAISGWRKNNFLLSDCGIYYGKINYYSLSKMESIDIDTIDDWRIAQSLFHSEQHSLMTEIEPDYWLEQAI